MSQSLFTAAEFRRAFPKAVRGEAVSEPSYARADITAALLPDGTLRILSGQNADRAVHPASLSKLALFIIAFDLIEQRKLHPSDHLTISNRARKIARPVSGLAGMQVGDALSLMAVASCNDIAVALAEHIAGSEWKFVQHYVRPLAQQLNLRHTEFWNATGLPLDQSIYKGPHYLLPDSVTTAHDLLSLSAALIHRHPQYLAISAQQNISVQGRTFSSTNLLLRAGSQDIGKVDGLKTGSLMASGYHLAATALKNDTRLIAIALGAPAPDMRFRRGEELLRAGFQALQPI